MGATDVSPVMESAGSWDVKKDSKSSTSELSGNTGGTCSNPALTQHQAQLAVNGHQEQSCKEAGEPGRAWALLPAGLNSHSLAEKEPVGTSHCRVQMGLNERGDGNDDNYSNSSPSLCPWEAGAASVI